jgi:Zn-dependent protease with chaperone function
MAGLSLYLATLALELPGAAVRYWLAGLLGLLIGWLGPVDANAVAAPLAIGAALGPSAWSLGAFALPGRGLWWRWASGGREPSERERETYQDALEQLQDGLGERPARIPRRFFVLDVEDAQAAVRGDALVLSRGLLEHGAASLPAVLAHELGHIGTLDGRLTEALNRLLLWGDPVGPRRPQPLASGDPVLVAACERPGCLSGLFRAFWRLFCSGSPGAGLGCSFCVRSGAHWRGREYAADAFAAALGQGEELADFLEGHALFFDLPVPFLWASGEPHPPVELRIDRLRRGAPAEVA